MKKIILLTILLATLAISNNSIPKETPFNNSLPATIQKINPEFYQEWCIGFIKGCLNSYSNISSNLISAEYPISKNLIPIYEFSCYVKFLTEYKDHFKCIDDQTIFGDIIENLINKIYSVSEHNDVKTFNQFIKNNNESITTYIIPYLTKDQIDDLGWEYDALNGLKVLSYCYPIKKS